MMGQIYEFQRRQKEAGKSETAELLAELAAKEKRGELKGFLHIEDDGRATKWGMVGSFKERYQFAGYTLIKALGIISDFIAQDGTAGHTQGPSQSGTVYTHPPRRGQPRRLREATDFGELPWKPHL
jgi:hypothetical protein